MRAGGKVAAVAAVAAVGALGYGCAAAMQNYEKVSLGMTADQVLSVAGKPHRRFRMESSGQGTILPTPAGASETWFYKGGVIQFHDGKVVAKGEKVP